jgi:hypothetical protein
MAVRAVCASVTQRAATCGSRQSAPISRNRAPRVCANRSRPAAMSASAAPRVLGSALRRRCRLISASASSNATVSRSTSSGSNGRRAGAPRRLCRLALWHARLNMASAFRTALRSLRTSRGAEVRSRDRRVSARAVRDHRRATAGSRRSPRRSPRSSVNVLARTRCRKNALRASEPTKGGARRQRSSSAIVAPATTRSSAEAASACAAVSGHNVLSPRSKIRTSPIARSISASAALSSAHASGSLTNGHDRKHASRSSFGLRPSSEPTSSVIHIGVRRAQMLVNRQRPRW